MENRNQMVDPNSPMQSPRYKPRWYRAEVLFQLEAGGVVPAGATGQGSVTIQNTEFLMTRINAANVGSSNIDESNYPGPLAGLAFDAVVPLGYTFGMRTDSHVYMTDQVPLEPAIGTTQDYFDMASPVILVPKATVTFDVTSTFQRTAPTKLAFVLHGVERAEAYPERL